MEVLDVKLLNTIVVVVFSAVIGAWVKDLWERRPKLIAYLWHANAIHVPATATAQAFVVHIHSVVIRNSGRRTSTKVRLGHHNVQFWYSVYPDGLHTERRLPGGGIEIEFERFVRNQQATITYLYSAPLTWDAINTHIQDEDGAARILNVLPLPIPSRGAKTGIWFLMACGAILILYFVITMIRAYWPLG